MALVCVEKGGLSGQALCERVRLNRVQDVHTQIVLEEVGSDAAEEDTGVQKAALWLVTPAQRRVDLLALAVHGMTRQPVVVEGGQCWRGRL